MSKVQKNKPIRTCAKTYKDYKSFKPHLRDDFNKRCGYCDDNDFYAGGKRSYHIDHFKPHSIERFKHLKETYSNLVYSCPYCNNAKSNNWESKSGFIDPCEDEYDNHIERTIKGNIQYKTDQGKYIFENLKLGLRRHELLWCIEKLQEQKKDIGTRLDNCKNINELEVAQQFIAIQEKIDEYTTIFQEEI